MTKNKNAVALGKLGGAVTGGAKADASRSNGALGGRPRKVTTRKRYAQPRDYYEQERKADHVHPRSKRIRAIEQRAGGTK